MTISTFARYSRAILPFALVLGFASAPATAALQTYGFGAITTNLAGDVTIGEAQLFVDVADVGTTQASFTFRNTGPLASSITDVYFDDGSLLGIASIINGTGVLFSQDASPPDLPAGAGITPAFNTTAGFLADSDPPVQPNGVNPLEFMTIVFDLIAGQTIDDVFAALELGLTDGANADALRIGIHVQGFASGGSESFINTECVVDCGGIPPVVIPEPGGLALLGLGLAGLAAIRRRRLPV